MAGQEKQGPSPFLSAATQLISLNPGTWANSDPHSDLFEASENATGSVTNEKVQ